MSGICLLALVLLHHILGTGERQRYGSNDDSVLAILRQDLTKDTRNGGESVREIHIVGQGRCSAVDGRHARFNHQALLAIDVVTHRKYHHSDVLARSRDLVVGLNPRIDRH
jgi:ribosomal protein L14